MSNPIRLTNRTAVNLRKSAIRVKKTFFILAVVLSACMAALAVYLGLKRLYAVPLVVLLAVALDTMIVIFGRSIYLSMLAQAICTEAAAREIRAGSSESQRREKAITDLISAKADVELAKKEKRKKPGAISEEIQKNMKALDEEGVRVDCVRKTADKNMPERLTEKKETQESGEMDGSAPRRRRRSDGLKIIRGEQVK